MTTSPSARPFAIALAGCVAAVALGVAVPLGAQGIAGFNSNAPVNYAADRIELQDKQNRVILSGNVDINQGDLRLRAARTNVAYTDAGSLKIQRIDATGGVVITRGNESARGNVGIYDFNRKIITLVGNVALLRGTDTLNGGRLVMDLNTGVTRVDGRAGGGSGPGGRVTGSFSAPKSR
jgi:lipopolysaccharide export system protein LptA